MWPEKGSILFFGLKIMLNTLFATALSASLIFTPVSTGDLNVAGQTGQLVEVGHQVLASEVMDLGNRYPVASISNGFKENILVALGYLSLQGETLQAQNGFYFVLLPKEIFAFHRKGILPEFNESKIITQESDFTTNYGYKVVAGLGGNGVCHLASFINWVASEAGLEVIAPTNHNFAAIPGIDKKYGTSISTRNSPERQNLYIRNNFDFPVEFRFFLLGDNLSLTIFAINQLN